MAKGLLLVFSEPGKLVPEEEFHDWYEGEHIPLRLPIPEFLDAIRYKAVDSETPTWAALYAISDTDIFSKDAYTRLRANRSEREGALVKKLSILDRRCYDLLSDTGAAPGKATMVIVTNSQTPAPANVEAFNKWYEEEHTPLLSKVPGWVRTRRYILTDAVRNGVDAGEYQIPTHLAIHEWESSAAFDTPEYKAALNTKWRDEDQAGGIDAKERRVWGLYKTFKEDTSA